MAIEEAITDALGDNTVITYYNYIVLFVALNYFKMHYILGT